MIVYGSNSSHLLTEPVTAAPCHVCGASDSLRMSVFGRYTHVYWLPLFPAGKLGGAECRHCQQVTEHNQLPSHLQSHFSTLKQRANAPAWHYAGLLLMALMGLGTFTASGLNNKEDIAFLNRPHTGDLYHVRTQEGNFSLLKVVAVDGNSVQLQANTYQTSNSATVAELNKPENYDRESFDLTRYDLQIMRQKEQILDVERPE